MITCPNKISGTFTNLELNQHYTPLLIKPEKLLLIGTPEKWDLRLVGTSFGPIELKLLVLLT